MIWGAMPHGSPLPSSQMLSGMTLENSCKPLGIVPCFVNVLHRARLAKLYKQTHHLYKHVSFYCMEFLSPYAHKLSLEYLRAEQCMASHWADFLSHVSGKVKPFSSL